MSAAVRGITLRGIEALPVEVESEITTGMFSFTVVGLPDAAVRESRERVRAALREVGVTIYGRIAVNLAPADLPKQGSLLDLPIAVALAAEKKFIKPTRPAVYMGELSLDGRVLYMVPCLQRSLHVFWGFPSTVRRQMQPKWLL